MTGKITAVTNRLNELIPGATTNILFRDGLVELSALVGTGQESPRFYFVWPEQVWSDMTTEQIVDLVGPYVESELQENENV